MYPDDRVLVGVVNRKRDLDYLLKSHWYRIPRNQLQDGVFVEYLAFYLSGSASRQHDGGSGVHFYAPRRGVELTYRRDLLPEETEHPRANDVYYKVQLGEIIDKRPTITNPTKRSISFIITTWDRFTSATIIADLYSKGDYFVDRIYHALRDKRVPSVRYWDAQKKETGYGAALRVVCENGHVTAYSEPTYQDDNGLYLDPQLPEDKILAEIRARISSMGGAVTLPLPPTR